MATTEQLQTPTEGANKDSGGPWAALVRWWRQSRFANRRRYRRYDVDVAIEVASGGRIHSRALANISGGGALLVPALDCQIGCVVRLTARHLPMTLSGKVVSQSDQGTGIKFDSTLSGSFATLWLNTMSPENSPEPKR